MQSWHLKVVACYGNFMGISMVSALGQDRELEDAFGILSDVERKGILKAPNCQHLTYMVKDPGGSDCTKCAVFWSAAWLLSSTSNSPPPNLILDFFFFKKNVCFKMNQPESLQVFLFCFQPVGFVL